MKTAPLRIVKSQTVRGFDGTSKIEGSPYFERLVKLIPGEIISMYTFGVGLIPAEDPNGLWVWTVICMIMLLVLRIVATKAGEGFDSVQWAAVAISFVSFIIWLYTLGGVFSTLPFYKAYYGSLAVIVWTFFVPYFYKGD